MKKSSASKQGELALPKPKRPRFKAAVQVMRPDVFEQEPVEVNPKHQWEVEWAYLTRYNESVDF